MSGTQATLSKFFSPVSKSPPAKSSVVDKSNEAEPAAKRRKTEETPSKPTQRNTTSKATVTKTPPKSKASPAKATPTKTPPKRRIVEEDDDEAAILDDLASDGADDDFKADSMSVDDSVSSGVPEDEEEEVPKKSNGKRKRSNDDADADEEADTDRVAPAASAKTQTAAEIAARLQSIQPDEERHRMFSNKITGFGRTLRGETGEPEDDDEPDDGDDGDDVMEIDDEPKGNAKSKGPPKPGTKVKYTPLEQQYLEVKAKHADTVLFVEAGYRYRFFGKDAEVASKVLGIMASWSHNFLTASIPTHRLHVHARRIVQAGYKVGVVSQTETAALKKAGSNKSGPFARALTGLYTKGTMVGGEIDPLLAGDVNLGNFLMAIFEEASQMEPSKVRISVAAVKTSTGEIIWDTFDDSFLRNELETRLRHIRPIEIIYPTALSEPSKKLIRVFQVESQDASTLPTTQSKSASSTTTTTTLDGLRIEEISPSRFDDERALQTVEGILQGSTTASAKFLQAFPRIMLKCIGGLISYLKDFGLANLFCLECNYIHFSETSRMRLDGKTLDNLELIRNQTNGSHKGSLLWILDRTRSVFGKRLLTSWLQYPLTDFQGIVDRQDAVEELSQNDIPARIMLLLDLLPALPDLERGITRVYYNRCSVEEFLAVLKGFRSVSQAALNPDQVDETVKSPFLRRLLKNIKPELAEEIDSFLEVINPDAKSSDKHNIFHPDKEHLFPKIAACRTRIKEIESTLDQHLVEVRKQLGMPKLQYVTKSNEDFVIEIEKAYVKKVPSQWHKLSATKAVERFHTTVVREQLVFLGQEKEKLQIESMSAWTQLLVRFSNQYPQLRDVISSLSQLDCLFSLVNVAKQDGYVRPKITDDGVLNIVAGRHPIVEALLPEPFVPNDTSLASNGNTCAILTGPNMGGKTSYARQVALITIMAQIGSFVPAERASITPVDAVLTRMGAADDEIRGHSTFFVELQETAEILRTATDRSLVILDELGRGTSTYDGFAIAYATLHYILSSINCFTLFVTHYPGLSQFESLFPTRATNWHMGFLLNEISDSSDPQRPVITFLYKLASGVEPRSYGLNVARLAQLPDTVISVAEDKSSHLEKEVWARTLASSLRAVMASASHVSSAPEDEAALREVQLQLKSALASRRT